MEILHIDDEEDFTELTAKFLKLYSDDYNFHSYTDPKEALEEIMKHQDFDVILCDYQMPTMNGLQVLSKIRNENIKKPFIMVTGKGREEVVIQALNLGANYYLQKSGGETFYKELHYYIQSSFENFTTNALLKESEEKYRQLVENLPMGIVIHTQGKIVYVNKETMRLGGVSSEDEMLGKNVYDFVHTDSIIVTKERIKAIYEKIAPGELRKSKFLDITGKEFPVEVLSRMIDYNGKAAAQVIFRDITDEELITAEKKKSEKRYKELVEFLPECIFETDNQLNITFANNEAYQMFGYSEQEVKEGLNIIKLIMPEEIEKAQQNIQLLISGQRVSPNNYWFKRKNGSKIFCQIHNTSIVRNGKFKGILGIIREIKLDQDKKEEEKNKQK